VYNGNSIIPMPVSRNFLTFSISALAVRPQPIFMQNGSKGCAVKIATSHLIPRPAKALEFSKF